jgi:hypothetical protein
LKIRCPKADIQRSAGSTRMTLPLVQRPVASRRRHFVGLVKLAELDFDSVAAACLEIV